MQHGRSGCTAAWGGLVHTACVHQCASYAVLKPSIYPLSPPAVKFFPAGKPATKDNMQE